MTPDAAAHRNCTGPVSNLVDFVPFLRNFPNWTMVNRGKRLHQGLVDTCGGLINDIDRRMRAGEEVPDCMAKYLLSVKEQENLDDLDVIFSTAEGTRLAEDTSHALTPDVINHMTGPCGITLE